MFSRKFDRRIHFTLLTLLGSVLAGTVFGVYALWPANVETGYEPAQPMAYSHRLHAGDLQIECLYCHSNAEKNAVASVPSVGTCMKCHKEVQTKDSKGNIKPGIAYLLDKWEKKEPIVWGKVHDLADFVYFDHSRHSNAAIECQECHGPVETYENMKRTFSLKMAWCLECHKQPAKDESGNIIIDKNRASIDCSTCHR